MLSFRTGKVRESRGNCVENIPYNTAEIISQRKNETNKTIISQEKTGVDSLSGQYCRAVSFFGICTYVLESVPLTGAAMPAASVGGEAGKLTLTDMLLGGWLGAEVEEGGRDAMVESGE